ncbi:MAG TPA: DUF6328 family protein [Trebonia sp.]|nr:DUF6328 family protein [Trebonia sp.]
MRSPAQQERSSLAPDQRRETLAQRDDRNLAELVQELRVVSLGVQVLFGFLLSLPFTASAITAVIACGLAGVWFALPLRRRVRE